MSLRNRTKKIPEIIFPNSKTRFTIVEFEKESPGVQNYPLIFLDTHITSLYIPFTMENHGRASTPTKSILKSKSSSSTNPLRTSVSTPTKLSQKRKKVEITLPHSVKSDEIQGGMKNFRETPIPRVAFLAKAPTPLPQAKPKSAKKSSTKSSKRSLSANTTDQGSKVKGTTPKKKKSSKKLKSKSKSRAEIPHEELAANAGRQYMKELGTINQILKSVTDPATHSGHESELIEGFIRPFSSEELQQLLQSIGNVATIHQHIPGGSEAAESVVNGMKRSKPKLAKASGSKSKPLDVLKFASKSLPAISNKILRSSESTKSNKSSSKSKKRKNAKSSSNITTKKSVSLRSKTPGTSKPAMSAKSTKSSVKSLFKPVNLKPTTSKKKSKKKGSKTAARRSSDSVVSELSEMDLIKSAVLNRRYYEESMALERRVSRAVESKIQKINSAKKRSKSRDERNKLLKLSSTDELTKTLSPISSLIASSMSSKSDELSRREEHTSRGLKSLEKTLGAISRHRTGVSENYAKDVLINHSHVIRVPELKNLSNRPSMERQNNRGFANPRPLPFKRDLDLSEVIGFDEHLQKIKYPGAAPVMQGILEITPPMTKLVANATELTGKYLRNERILEETRNKAASGVGKKDSSEYGSLLKSVPNHAGKHNIIEKAQGQERSSMDGQKSRNKSKGHAEGADSKSKIKSILHSTKVSEKMQAEPTVENLAKAPSTWNDNSISASRDQVARDGGSRWSMLNHKTVKKSREIKSRSLGRRRDIPKDDLDAIRRTLETSDERQQYLDNIVQARADFDTYSAFYDGKDQENKKTNKQGVGWYQKDYGQESYSFDPRTNPRGKTMF